MFANSDYAAYMREAEKIFSDMLELNTDLMNVTESKEIQNRLNVLLTEDAETFRFFLQKRKMWEGGRA